MKVATGSVRGCVRVIVAGGDFGLTGIEHEVSVAAMKLVYVAPGRVRVYVLSSGPVAGPTGMEHEVTVWTLLSVFVDVAPSSDEISVSYIVRPGCTNTTVLV
jgi:hypothetical protein